MLHNRLIRDGSNLTTLLKLCKNSPSTLLVIKDTNNAVFGALVQDQIWHNEGEKYYGNGTCKVFTFHNSNDDMDSKDNEPPLTDQKVNKVIKPIYFKVHNNPYKSNFYR